MWPFWTLIIEGSQRGCWMVQVLECLTRAGFEGAGKWQDEVAKPEVTRAVARGPDT